MLLKKVKLQNIRSYKNQEISFPEGSILLSGDIGSGKSTILLAIDFALFGLRRGILSGSSLLRNGTDRGGVELHFNISNKDVVIKRTLKREKSVTQDSGFVMINENKKEGTATEIKQLALNLLNYPKDLLTKNKDLIYSYTVYTPQEEMKHILLTDKETRLDILRKIFGIDKYKRINDNSKIFLTKVREKKKEFSGMISDLENKKQEKQEKQSKIEDLNKKLLSLKESLENLDKKISDKTSLFERTESEISKLNELKKQLELTTLDLKHKKDSLQRNQPEMENLRSSINILKEEVKDVPEENIKEEISNKESKLREAEKELEEITKKVQEYEIIKNQSEDLKDKISKLDICPVCKQTVTQEHKHSINYEEDKKLQEISKNSMLSKQKQLKSGEEVTKLREKLDSLRKQEQQISLFKIKQENLKEKTEKLDSLLKQQATLGEEIEDLDSKKTEISSNLDKYKDTESIHNTIKEELENLQKQKKDLEIEAATFNRELKDTKDFLETIDKEIQKKLDIKNKIEKLDSTQNLIQEIFNNLMTNMEKQIMLKVHSDFDSLFQKWFGILVETEALKIRLDHDFTPLIEQNGYDIDYLHLSGGEKTAAALAYRLALNQVINNLMSTIETKDLLILDEPTDGFSDEQIDRIKLVLDELKIQQVVIVSHESKIESFVDSIIKINKNNHISAVS